MRRAALLLVLLAGCSSESAVPTATILETAPALLDPDDDAADDLTIVVRYHDGDGDLGGGVAEVIDCRVENLVTTLALPPIASDEAVAEGVPIDGELELLVADVGRVPAEPVVTPECVRLGVPETPIADAVSFCVVLVDAAGHRGPGACTSPVALRP